MGKYGYFEVLVQGPVLKIRLLNHSPLFVEEVAEMASEWNALADRVDCQSLVVDCSAIQCMSSEMLSKLILLQRRLTKKNAALILSGLHADVREVLRWTKLDRLFAIEETVTAPA